MYTPLRPRKILSNLQGRWHADLPRTGRYGNATNWVSAVLSNVACDFTSCATVHEFHTYQSPSRSSSVIGVCCSEMLPSWCQLIALPFRLHT